VKRKRSLTSRTNITLITGLTLDGAYRLGGFVCPDAKDISKTQFFSMDNATPTFVLCIRPHETETKLYTAVYI
jgi:hypothetical protein